MLTGIKFVSRKKPTVTSNDDKTGDECTTSKSKSTDSHSHRHKSNKNSHHKSKKSKYEHIESSEVDFNINNDDLELLTEKDEKKQNHYSYRESSYLPHENSKYEEARYSDYDTGRREVSSLPSSTVDTTQLTHASNTPSQSAAAAAVTSAVVNNRCAADLLRQRLKNKIPLSSSAAPSSALPSSSLSLSLTDNTRTDYNTDMLNIIKIKKQIEIKSSLNKISSNNTNNKNSDNNISLADLVAAEKLFNTSHDTYHNMDQVYAKNILRLGGHYKGSELNGGSGVSGDGRGSSSNKVDRSGADEDEDIDMSLFQDRSSYGGGGSNNNKDKKKGQRNKESSNNKSEMLEKQVQQEVKRYNQFNDIKSHCEKCNCRNLKYGTATIIISNNINNNNNSSQGQQLFYISKSTHVCLKLKESKLSLLPHHCVLIPITNHVPSFLHCDEDTMREIERYKSCLSYQFQKDHKIMLVLESSGNSNSNNQKTKQHHTSLDIIPLPQSYLDECIMYFKEAFLSMSHQGRLVELTAKRGLKKAVPIGFQYISVEWGERISVNSNNNSSSNRTDRDDDDHSGKVKKTSSIATTSTSRTMSSTCTGLVLIFDCENEESDNDDEGDSGSNNNTHQDFGLDVLASMLEEDSYRIRRRMNKHNKVIDAVEEKKRYESFLQEWPSYDWTQYETATAIST